MDKLDIQNKVKIVCNENDLTLCIPFKTFSEWKKVLSKSSYSFIDLLNHSIPAVTEICYDESIEKRLNKQFYMANSRLRKSGNGGRCGGGRQRSEFIPGIVAGTVWLPANSETG